MKTLRTPDERFENLPGYPFKPNYLQIDDGDGGELRMHYVCEGPADGEVLLCMHGQPMWSYLYRKMIAPLTEAGYRVICPDLVGFGKSDKPIERSDYTYANHVGWLERFVLGLNLNNVTLVCQDWGGLLGLRVVTANPDRFARVVVANTGLPDAKGIPEEMAGPMRAMFDSIPALSVPEMGAKMRENENGAGFMYWIKHCDSYADFKVSNVVAMSSGGALADDLSRAYDAPFPSEEYQQAARQFPALVPIFPDDPAIADNRAAWQILENFDKPFLTSFTDSDPVTAGGHVRFQESIPGAKGQKHATLKGVGHFLQEEAGEEFAQIVVDFCAANPI